jgi:hypothetical protein
MESEGRNDRSSSLDSTVSELCKNPLIRVYSAASEASSPGSDKELGFSNFWVRDERSVASDPTTNVDSRDIAVCTQAPSSIPYLQGLATYPMKRCSMKRKSTISGIRNSWDCVRTKTLEEWSKSTQVKPNIFAVEEDTWPTTNSKKRMARESTLDLRTLSSMLLSRFLLESILRNRKNLRKNKRK